MDNGRQMHKTLPAEISPLATVCDSIYGHLYFTAKTSQAGAKMPEAMLTYGV